MFYIGTSVLRSPLSSLCRNIQYTGFKVSVKYLMRNGNSKQPKRNEKAETACKTFRSTVKFINTKIFDTSIIVGFLYVYNTAQISHYIVCNLNLTIKILINSFFILLIKTIDDCY